MIVEFNRNGVLNSYFNVSRIIDADSYLVLEPIHDVIKYYINSEWVCNCEGVTVIKDFTDLRVML